MLLPAGYFPRKGALFFIALVLGLPWTIFVFRLGIVLIFIPLIGEFFLLVGGGEGGALGAMIGNALIAIAIGLHLDGMWFVSHRGKKRQRRMEQAQEAAQKKVQGKKVQGKAWGASFPAWSVWIVGMARNGLKWLCMVANGMRLRASAD